MKKVTLITCVLALLSAMSIIGCANPAGSETTPTVVLPEGNYVATKMNGVFPPLAIDLNVQDGKSKFLGFEFDIKSDKTVVATKPENGFTGTWDYEGDKLLVNITLSDGKTKFALELINPKILAGNWKVQSAKDKDGNAISNITNTNITVNSDGKTGTMPNPQDNNSTTDFKIMNNKIMIGSDSKTEFGTLLDMSPSLLKMKLKADESVWTFVKK